MNKYQLKKYHFFIVLPVLSQLIPKRGINGSCILAFKPIKFLNLFTH